MAFPEWKKMIIIEMMIMGFPEWVMMIMIHSLDFRMRKKNIDKALTP